MRHHPRPSLRMAQTVLVMVGAALAAALPMVTARPALASTSDGLYDPGSIVTVYGHVQGLQVVLDHVDVSGQDPASAATMVAQQVNNSTRNRAITIGMHPQGAPARELHFIAASLLPEIATPVLPPAADGPVSADLIVALKSDWLARTAARLSAKPLVKPIDAVARVGGPRGLRISKGRDGVAVDKRGAPAALVAALTTGIGELALRSVAPSVRTTTLDTVLVIRRHANTLQWFAKGRLARTFRVATGSPGYPTPLGTLHVVQKEPAPSWYNPHRDWSRYLPDVIGPGPNNPLGTRALALSAPGILIHGIPAVENTSIGSNASHGCIRMLRRDAEFLYPRVPLGATVIVLR